MFTPQILALSSSKAGNSSYLETAIPYIQRFLGDKSQNIAFIPFASVERPYQNYLAKVQEGLASLNHIINLAEPANAKKQIEQSDVVMIGGGNTFKLLHDLYAFDLLELIKEKVKAGTLYIGWSAGANITGLTIGTTNDMPIIQPKSFHAFGFFPFQINPHYINQVAVGHNGETRDQRLEEITKMNPSASIVGLPEGTALLAVKEQLTFLGRAAGIIFKDENGSFVRQPVEPNADLTFLLQ